MYCLNKVQIIGNCTRDPEMKQTPGGQFVANIGVATNRQWKDKQTGEQKEQVEFHNITVWGKLAEICGQYLKKGSKVYFEGRLQTRNWDDDKGVKHYRTDIVAENMIMLGGRGDAPSSGGDFSGGVARRADNAPTMSAVPEGEKIKVEDLPF